MSSIIRRAKALRGDLALWDGVSSSISRLDASGGTVTGLPVGVEIDVLQIFGNGTAQTAASILSAIARMGSRARTLVFSSGTWTIDVNVTIPSNLTCHIPAGCV